MEEPNVLYIKPIHPPVHELKYDPNQTIGELTAIVTSMVMPGEGYVIKLFHGGSYLQDPKKKVKDCNIGSSEEIQAVVAKASLDHIESESMTKNQLPEFVNNGILI